MINFRFSNESLSAGVLKLLSTCPEEVRNVSGTFLRKKSFDYTYNFCYFRKLSQKFLAFVENFLARFSKLQGKCPFEHFQDKRFFEKVSFFKYFWTTSKNVSILWQILFATVVTVVEAAFYVSRRIFWRLKIFVPKT